MTAEQRKQPAERIEQKIGDMLRGQGVLMDGYMKREVESVAANLAFKAIEQKELVETR
jgi:hypothetical protein